MGISEPTLHNNFSTPEIANIRGICSIRGSGCPLICGDRATVTLPVTFRLSDGSALQFQGILELCVQYELLLTAATPAPPGLRLPPFQLT